MLMRSDVELKNEDFENALKTLEAVDMVTKEFKHKTKHKYFCFPAIGSLPAVSSISPTKATLRALTQVVPEASPHHRLPHRQANPASYSNRGRGRLLGFLERVLGRLALSNGDTASQKSIALHL